MSNFNQRKDFLRESLLHNTLKSDRIFTRKRFSLDTARNFNDIDVNEMKVAFKGFWVVDASDLDFICSMKPNARQEYATDPLPLKKNMSFDFDELVDGAVLEWPEQAGKWVDIIFIHRGSAAVGNIEIDISGRTIPVTGDQFDNDSFTVTTAGVQILPVNSNRSRSTIFNNSGQTIYVGTQATVTGGSHTTKCVRVNSGAEFAWSNTNSLYAITDTSDCDVVVLNEE